MNILLNKLILLESEKILFIINSNYIFKKGIFYIFFKDTLNILQGYILQKILTSI